MSDRPQLSLLYDVWTLSNLTERVMAGALAPADLTPSDFALYSLLKVHGPFTPTELARASGSPAQSLTYALRRAEARGHVQKRPSSSDRRSYAVSLTPAGLEVHHRAEELFRGVITDVEAGLDGDVETVRAVLGTLRTSLQRTAGL